jgi:hypothetical protein
MYYSRRCCDRYIWAAAFLQVGCLEAFIKLPFWQRKNRLNFAVPLFLMCALSGILIFL